MRSTFKQLYYINRAKVKADGTAAVLCRITIDGKNSVITTGIYCKPEDFNTTKGEVKDGKVSGTILKFRERIGQTYEQILKEQGGIIVLPPSLYESPLPDEPNVQGEPV